MSLPVININVNYDDEKGTVVVFDAFTNDRIFLQRKSEPFCPALKTKTRT